MSIQSQVDDAERAELLKLFMAVAVAGITSGNVDFYNHPGLLANKAFDVADACAEVFQRRSKR